MADNPNTGSIDEVTPQGSDSPAEELEKQEEVKLTSRYPGAMKPMAGHSAFLQKRLTKGQKYFDSGDYQMAKQTGKSNNLFASRIMPPILSVAPEIPAHPTPDSVPHRKASLVQQQSKLANAN